MAEIQAGTRFAAIAPSVDVERRSALVNTTALDYTIEDIAAAVSGDIDLTEYLTIANAATTYQPLSGMSSYLTTANAATTYQTLSGMSSYLTTANAATTYQTLSGMSSSVNTIVFGGSRADAFFYGTQDVFTGSQFYFMSQVRNQRYGTLYIDPNGYTFSQGSAVFASIESSFISSNSVVMFNILNTQPLSQRVSVYCSVSPGIVGFGVYMDSALSGGIGIQYAIM